MVKATKGYIILLGLILSFTPERSLASSSREFLMSAGYGVLAGTMVGAASLAFSEARNETPLRHFRNCPASSVATQVRRPRSKIAASFSQ